MSHVTNFLFTCGKCWKKRQSQASWHMIFSFYIWYIRKGAEVRSYFQNHTLLASYPATFTSWLHHILHFYSIFIKNVKILIITWWLKCFGTVYFWYYIFYLINNMQLHQWYPALFLEINHPFHFNPNLLLKVILSSWVRCALLGLEQGCH